MVLLATAQAKHGDEAEEQAGRAQRRDQQVQRVLEAAKTCFVRSGFQGASMHHICAEAGMSPGALYRYFPSKEAIIEAIAAADRRQDVEMLAAISTIPHVIDGIVAAAMSHIQYIHQSGNAPLFVEIRAEAMRNEAVRQSSMKCMEDAEQVFRSRLRDALAAGDIDPVVDLDTLLTVLMAIGEGMTMSDLPTRGVALESIETVLRAMLQALLRPRTNPRQ